MLRKAVLFAKSYGGILLAATAIALLAFSLVADKTKNICGESQSVAQTRIPSEDNKYNYTTDNSGGGLRSNKIRTLTMGRNGLWIGYADGVGVGHFDGHNWRFCLQTPHVNAIVLDRAGNPWVGTDAPPPKKGMPYSNALLHLHYDGTWGDASRMLPDFRVYDLAFEQTLYRPLLYAATWEGVAMFDDQNWTVPYRAGRDLGNNHIHAIAFTRHGDIWFGSIDAGITWHSMIDPKQRVFLRSQITTANTPELKSDKIREITVSPTGESVWIATDGGGVSVYDYATDKWENYMTPVVLHNRVMDIEFDYLGRPWVATLGGVFYLDSFGTGHILSDVPSMAIAFGCQGCPIDQTNYFVGTVDSGLLQGSVSTD